MTIAEKHFRGIKPTDVNGRSGLRNPERGFRFEIRVAHLTEDGSIGTAVPQWPFEKYACDGITIAQAVCRRPALPLLKNRLKNPRIKIGTRVTRRNPSNAEDLTYCEIEGRRQVRAITDIFRKHLKAKSPQLSALSSGIDISLVAPQKVRKVLEEGGSCNK